MTHLTTCKSQPASTRRESVLVPGVLAWMLLAVLAGGGWLVGAWALHRSKSGSTDRLPVLGELPVFALTSQSGQPFGSENLHGRVWVADFFFTDCPGPCLAMNQRLKQVRAEAPADLRCVSITIDPQTDRPAVLARYAARLGVEQTSPDWLFLTGSQETIYRLAREGFHLAAAGPAELRDASLAEFLHSTRFALVDGKNRVRGYYESTDDAERRRLRVDIARLETESF